MKKDNFLSKKATISKSLICKEMGKKYYVLDPEAGKIYILNEMSTLIWKQISLHVSFQTVVKNITSTYKVSPEKVVSDLKKFLKRNEERKLLKLDA
jgi:hypothetical protein